MKKILIGCEESQTVCIEFRKLGYDAYSCDLIESSGGFPEWHLQMDIMEALKLMKWDMLIAFPPCDHLSKAGAAHWKKPHKQILQQQSLAFVKELMNLPIQFIAIENPVGKINTAIRKPDQKIQPYQFGHPYTKETCLWLKNLPPLSFTNVVEPVANWVKPGNIRKRKFSDVPEGAKGNKKLRSKTFQGIAKAMAEQWGNLL